MLTDTCDGEWEDDDEFFDVDNEYTDQPLTSDILMDECEQMFAKGGFDLVVACYKTYDCYQQMMADALFTVALCAEPDCLHCQMRYEMNRRTAGAMGLLHLSKILSRCDWLQDWNKTNDDIEPVIAWIVSCIRASREKDEGIVLEPSFCLS